MEKTDPAQEETKKRDDKQPQPAPGTKPEQKVEDKSTPAPPPKKEESKSAPQKTEKKSESAPPPPVTAGARTETRVCYLLQ